MLAVRLPLRFLLLRETLVSIHKPIEISDHEVGLASLWLHKRRRDTREWQRFASSQRGSAMYVLEPAKLDASYGVLGFGDHQVVFVRDAATPRAHGDSQLPVRVLGDADCAFVAWQ